MVFLFIPTESLGGCEWLSSVQYRFDPSLQSDHFVVDFVCVQCFRGVNIVSELL